MQARPNARSDHDELPLLDDEGPVTLGFDGPPPSIDELVAAGDGDKLLELGAAYRVGAPHVARDAFKALECFEAASHLGNAEAEYLVGVAHFDAIGIKQDLAEGAKRLRSAAQRGSLRAKVYVANLYELGVYYQADREKADVWYRNVARAANVEATPDSHEYDLALAEFGCVRQCLKLVADEALPKKDRAFFLKKAKAMGYAHRLAALKRESADHANAAAPGADSAVASSVGAASVGAAAVGAAGVDRRADSSAADMELAKADAHAAPTTAPEARSGARGPEEEPHEVLLGGQWTWGPGLLAFLAASFFVGASSVAGWLAMEGSRALAAEGRGLPQVGERHWIVAALVLLALGVLPATSAYRGRVVAIAAALGGAAAAGGYFLFDVQRVAPDRVLQSAGAGLAAFLLALLLLGVLGGTRAKIVAKPTKRRRREH